MEMKSMEKWRILILVCCWCMFIPGLGHASVVVTGAGTGTGGDSISATALFELVSYDFGSGPVDAIQLTLTNTSSTTNYRGNLLTGFFWSMSGVDALPTDATGFDGLAPTVRTSNTASLSNVDIAPASNKSGLYLLANRGSSVWNANDGLNYDAYAYGISTVSMQLSGFNGSLTGGDEYGIAAPGTTIPDQNGLYKALPIIDGTAIFYIAKPEELTSLSQITNAAFGFGSLPDHRVEASVAAVPIPPTVLIFGSGLLGIFGVRRRLGRIS